MSETCKSLFYNSQSGDRVYDADSFEHLLKKFFTSGVFTGSCQVSADGSGMTCTVSTGYANCDGKIRLFDEETDLTFDNAHATYDRIDTVVVERNDTDREITCKVVKGSYSATPEATAPVRTNGVYQLVLAEVYIAAGATAVLQSAITDKRPATAVCGYVMCAVTTPDFSELFAQFQAQASEFIDTETDNFSDWFEAIKDQLDSDAAGHLQNEIDGITGLLGNSQMGTTAGTVTGAIAEHENEINGAGGLNFRVIKCTTAISIPASGSSVSMDINGLTDKHEVARWNFSESAENNPPANLTLTTYAGYFTLTNTGGTTSETIKPVFILPTEKSATNH